ncbi:DUF5808 domain-containing protein [Galbibacter sp.]|jgi:uncharacterized membrane protein|uniref:DUF5808 domain-containing protein n=1 Tax=Galbibacter sp. TaxID=2918471 RepID=UPI003A91ACA2
MNPKRRPTKELKEQWHKDSNNWKFGLLYYNKEDKRIFPPKRFKYLGWTVNFANPTSILVLSLIIIAIIVKAIYIDKS